MREVTCEERRLRDRGGGAAVPVATAVLSVVRPPEGAVIMFELALEDVAARAQGAKENNMPHAASPFSSMQRKRTLQNEPQK